MMICEAFDSDLKVAKVSISNSARRTLAAPNLRNYASRLADLRLSSLLLLAPLSLAFLLAGCTQSLKMNSSSSSSSGSIEVSPDAVNFGAVPVGQAASAGVSVANHGSTALQISSVKVTGQYFAVTGASDLPITVAAGGTYNLGVNFDPTAAGAASGQLTIGSNSANDGTITVGLSGAGTGTISPVLSGLSCTENSYTGPGEVSCGVTVSAGAGSSGVTVALASDNSAVTVPSTVTVASGATSAGFTAQVKAVTSAQTATLTASAGGVSQSVALELGASVAALSASTGSVAFGNVNVNTSSTQQVILTSAGEAPVTISSVSVVGSGFSVSGVSTPQTLNPNQTMTVNVQFDPTAPGAATGQLNIVSNASTNGSMTVGLSGTGTILILPTLNSLSCASASLTGPATDSCTVALSGPAPAGGMNVSLGSSAAAVTIPAIVQIPAGATSATFTVTAAAVSTAQTATLTATTSNSAESLVLQLGAYLPKLSVNSTDLTFGNVAVNSGAAQSLVLTSTGTAPVTVSAAAVSGAGFTVTGATFPLTLNPNQTVTLTAQFDPAAAGAATGALTLTSNSSTGASTVVNLSGTGTPVLKGLTCANASMTGAGTDSCTATLNAAAASGGFAVSLASNNGAVTVPASVTVAAGSDSVGFSATASVVNSASAVTLTANAGSVTEAFILELGASVPTLGVSTTNLAFGNVGVNSAAAQSLVLTSTGTAYVTVNSASVSGSGFSASGASFPLTLSPNQTATLTVQFDPTAAGAASGTLTLTSNSSTGTTTTINLSGTGLPALSGLTCASGSFSGAGTDSCTVTLNAAAPSGGFTASLASNNSAVSVPATVTVAGGATSASFTANVGSVSTSQTVTLTASAGSAAVAFALQLSVSTGQLSVNATSLNFGNVTLNTPSSQTVTLSNGALLPTTVSLATVVGSGFSLTGSLLPIVLTTGQTATFTVQFDPTTAGVSTGTLTIVSTSLTNPTTVVSLSGTGVTSSSLYEVNLTWGAPSNSPDPVAGYNVYRTPSGGTSYQQVNTTVLPTTPTAYTDTNVQDGQTYDYIVESVDADGNTSVPSNMAAVVIP